MTLSANEQGAKRDISHNKPEMPSCDGEPAAKVNVFLTVAAGSRVSGTVADGQSRADGAADLTRGGGPYACARIGLASRLPAFAQ